MGFFESALNILSGIMNDSAKRVDRLSDEEVEKKFNKPADEMRKAAASAHNFYEQRHNKDE